MPIESVQVEAITKRYGHHRALAGVDLELRAGSLCALLGPNGAGKSTLLGILSTLVRPTSGNVHYRRPGGSDSAQGNHLRREIGVLAHSSFVYGELTGIENLIFYARLYGVPNPETRARTLLDEVGLDERARERAARTYSRGMLQRVALARALLHDPSILLLDEPFTGLDRMGSQALARTLASAKQAGRILLVITHDFEAIAGFTDHVVVLKRGKVTHEVRKDSARGQAGGDHAGFSYDDLKAIYHHHTD